MRKSLNKKPSEVFRRVSNWVQRLDSCPALREEPMIPRWRDYELTERSLSAWATRESGARVKPRSPFWAFQPQFEYSRVGKGERIAGPPQCPRAAVLGPGAVLNEALLHVFTEADVKPAFVRLVYMDLVGHQVG